jgi:hypothetical protein
MKQYASAGIIALMAQKGGDAMLQKAADEDTRNGTIVKVEILKEEIRGEEAKVHYRIHYKDGQTKDDDASLIKEKGEWKLSG